MAIHATVIGNLGKDAEVKTVGQGRTVCNFSVAASNPRNKDQTTWVRCALWGQRGEKLQGYLTKGSRVAAVGTLTTRDYDGKTYVELEVTEIELLGDRKKAEDEAPPARPPARKPAPAPRTVASDYEENYADAESSDSIPF